MKIQGKCFYRFTRSFSDRVGSTTSFVWASYCGLWHIHKSASALGSLSEKPRWKKIEDYLVGEVPGRGGIDLHDISSKTWEDHQASYSDFILTQGAILYEDWSKSLGEMALVPGKKIKAETFQFPSSATSGKWTNWSALDVPGVLPASSFLKNEVQPALLTAYAKNISSLDVLLNWYRFYKELRNSIAHHGGLVRQENIDAYDIASSGSLLSAGIKRNFSGVRPILGRKIKLELHDAVLFLAIIQRLSLAFDAKFCHTTHAETNLIARLKDALAASPAPYELTAERKSSWIKKFLMHRGGVTPNSLPVAEAWLKSNDVLTIRVI